MTNKYWNKKKRILKIFLFALLILNFLVPISGVSSQIYTNFNTIDINNGEDLPKTQDFKEEDYEPILDEEKQGLGSIRVTDLDFTEKGIFNNSENYGDLEKDLESDYLNMSYVSTEFNGTKINAEVDNLEDIDIRYITIELNETISTQYNKTERWLEGYIIYSPILYQWNLTRLQVQNQSSLDPVDVDDGYYSISIINENLKYLKFNYNDYFNNREAHNFSLHLIYEYNLTIANWKLHQDADSSFTLEEIEEEIDPEFIYRFYVKGEKLNTTNIEQVILADDMTLFLKVNPPDKGDLMKHELSFDPELEDIIKGGDLDGHLDSDNSINVLEKDNFFANNSLFYLKFKAEFTIRFDDPVDETWAIDRLIGKRNERERIYFPEIVSGPDHIYIVNISIYEPTISIDQIKDDDYESLFDRTIEIDEVYITDFEEDIENSLIFTENATKKRGIEIKLPFMIKDEICPINVEYETSNDLRIIITDNIKMPIMGLDVKIYYYGESYGTYISKEKNQPMGPTTTDENGEILVQDVPNGDYKIIIYQEGAFIMKAECSSFLEINYIITDLPHFPLWIIIFGTVSLIVLLIGLIIYLIYRKER